VGCRTTKRLLDIVLFTKNQVPLSPPRPRPPPPLFHSSSSLSSSSSSSASRMNCSTSSPGSPHSCASCEVIGGESTVEALLERGGGREGGREGGRVGINLGGLVCRGTLDLEQCPDIFGGPTADHVRHKLAEQMEQRPHVQIVCSKHDFEQLVFCQPLGWDRFGDDADTTREASVQLEREGRGRGRGREMQNSTIRY
jgi:hypothetical protein